MRAARQLLSFGLIRGFFVAVLPLALSGCAAGVTGLVAAIFASGGGGGGAAPDPIVSSVEPRQSAVVGGVELELKGQNFDKTSQVSFGGIAATSTTFVDRETLRVVVPASFTGLASPAPDDPLKYTDTNPDLRMQVSNKKRFSFAPFWYMRPKIRSVFELVAGVELETYGHRTDRKTVYLRGDFFGFTRDPETEIRLIRLAGDTEIPVAVIRRQGASSDPFFWEISERETCTSLPCLADPHQGREIKITLPIEGDTLAAALVSGPVYILRVVNDSGVDDVDFGYAPPFPPVNFACSAVTLPGDSRAVQLTWDENDLNLPDAFDIVFVDRFDPVESRWVPLATVPGGVGEYLDDTVTTTNYVYRIYGRLGGGDYVGQNSPAVTCEVAVLPLGITDFIIDLSTKLKISPLGTSKISPLGAVRQAPTGAESLQGVIQGLGRQAFLLRGQRSVDQLSDSLSQFYDAGGQNIGITWVTTGDGLRFGVPPVDGLKDVLSYYRGITDDGRAARGLYIEGQHVVAALGAAIDADPVTVGGSGGAGERSELEAMLIEQLGEFDPRRDVETYDTVDGLSVDGVTGIQWSGRGVSAYGIQQARDALGQTGRVLSSATGRRGSGESAIAREVAAGLFVDLGLDGGPSARTIFSLLHVDGFTGTDARRRIVQRYIDRLGGARAVVPPRPGGLRIVPPSGLWGEPTPIAVETDDEDGGLERVTRVLFGGRPAVVQSKTPSRVVLTSPPGMLPGTVDVVLELTPAVEPADNKKAGDGGGGDAPPPETMVAGSFSFTVEEISISGLDPLDGPDTGGTFVFIAGESFTRAPDLQVTFGGVPAAIVDAVDTEIICISPPGAAGPVPLVVSTGGGQQSAEASFTYCRSGEEGCYSPEPIGPYIFSHSPRSGPAGGGTLMTVIGENFTRGTYALVCGQPLEDQLVELNVHEYEGQADRITGYTPPGCGTCEIEVVNLFGSDQRAQAFVYLPPSIVELGVIGAPDYPFIDPAGEGEIHLQLANYTVTTEVRLCGQPLAPTSVTGVGGIDTDFIADIPPGTHGTTCDLEVVEPASGCDPDTRPAFITYAAPGIPMLLLGVFSGADDPNDPISGDSILQEALVDSGFSPAEIEYPPDGSITLELLQRYEVVVFSDVENGSNDKGEKRDRDWLTEIEIVHLQQYAMDGGILLLLGQLDPPQGDIKAQDSSDRNEVARPFGIQFQRDVFVDEVNHIFYDGCAGAVACGAEPSQPTQGGDQDYGTEYPIIRLEDGILDKYRLLAPLFAGVDTAFLNWGQTLTVSASSYQVVALMRGTRGRSWGDADPLYKETSCRDDHLVTHFDGGEIDHYDAAGMIGVAASIVPRDGLSGIVLAFGDQDQFWNFYLGHPGSGGDYYCPGGDCCFGELKFSSLRFIQNLADFVRSR